MAFLSFPGARFLSEIVHKFFCSDIPTGIVVSVFRLQNKPCHSGILFLSASGPKSASPPFLPRHTDRPSPAIGPAGSMKKAGKRTLFPAPGLRNRFLPVCLLPLFSSQFPFSTKPEAMHNMFVFQSAPGTDAAFFFIKAVLRIQMDIRHIVDAMAANIASIPFSESSGRPHGAMPLHC